MLTDTYNHYKSKDNTHNKLSKFIDQYTYM